MPKIISYKSAIPYLSDYIIGTDISTDNVTRNYRVSDVVNTILASIGIGTVTSISTANSNFITGSTTNNGIAGPITTAGIITFSLPAVPNGAADPPINQVFLRGDNTWARPGPEPTDIAVKYNAFTLTDALGVNEIDFKGTGVETNESSTNVIQVEIKQDGDKVDQLDAGVGIAVSNGGIGNVVITNDGLLLARAGGNVTVSGGTGAVTVSTTKGQGSVISLTAGKGLDNVVNVATNPEIDVLYAAANNYINQVGDVEVISGDDVIAFQDISSNNVKTAQLRNITPEILTVVKNYIDTNDQNKIKNVEPINLTDTGVAKTMVTLTISQYNSIGVKDPNTLYFIVGAGQSYTVSPIVSNTITGGGSFTLNTTPSSVTGPVNSSYSFSTSISTSGSTYTPGNMNPNFVTSGVIPVGNTNIQIVATGTCVTATQPRVRAKLNDVNATGGNLSGFENVAWEYDSSYDLIGSFAPPSGFTLNTQSFSFNTRIKLTSTDSYIFTSIPSYEGDNGTSTSPLNWITGTVSNSTPGDITKNVGSGTGGTRNITATWALKEYNVSISNITESTTLLPAGSPAPTPYNWIFNPVSSATNNTITKSSDSLPSGAINVITGLNNAGVGNGGEFRFEVQSLTPSLDSEYEWTTDPTLGGTGATLQQINAGNGTAALTLSGGVITYTQAAQNQYRRLQIPSSVITSVITDTTSGNPNYTVANLTQNNGPSVSGNFSYILPTITANTGYILSGGAVAFAAPMSTGSVQGQYNSTLGRNTGGLTDTDPIIEGNASGYGVTISAGTLTQNQVTIVLNVTSTQSGANYTAQFTSATFGTTTLQTTGIQSSSQANIGNDGSFSITVSRTGNTVGQTTITYPVGSASNYAAGSPITSDTGNATSVLNGATVTVTIDENVPVSINPTGNLKLIAPPVSGYQVSYSYNFTWKKEDGTTGTRTRTLIAPSTTPYTSTGPQTFTNMAQSPTTGYGQATIVVSRTGPNGNVSSDSGSILIGKNGTQQFLKTFNPNEVVSGVTYTVTGLNATSDNVTIDVSES